jgi:hypothetical protein
VIFHNRTVRSVLALARMCPFGLNVTEWTAPVWPDVDQVYRRLDLELRPSTPSGGSPGTLADPVGVLTEPAELPTHGDRLPVRIAALPSWPHHSIGCVPVRIHALAWASSSLRSEADSARPLVKVRR